MTYMYLLLAQIDIINHPYAHFGYVHHLNNIEACELFLADCIGAATELLLNLLIVEAGSSGVGASVSSDPKLQVIIATLCSFRIPFVDLEPR
jgi:hypothetical protein